jgi:hypothetical protein
MQNIIHRYVNLGFVKGKELEKWGWRFAKVLRPKEGLASTMPEVGTKKNRIPKNPIL